MKVQGFLLTQAGWGGAGQGKGPGRGQPGRECVRRDGGMGETENVCVCGVARRVDDAGGEHQDWRFRESGLTLYFQFC